MCIIVYKPAGQKLDRETLARCWARNSDGVGFAGFNEGKPIMHKSLKKFKKVYQAYRRLIIEPELEEKIPLIWHFRIKTHGAINTENAHPFLLNGDNILFAHNGIISGGDYPTAGKESDTLRFKMEILDELQRLNENWITNEVIWKLIGNYIGKYGKAIFLDNKNNVSIYNEEGGEWDKEIWYSNTSYKLYKSYSYVSPGYNTMGIHRTHGPFCECHYCRSNDDEIDWTGNIYDNRRPARNVCSIYSFHCKYCKHRLISDQERRNCICVSCANTIIYNRLVYIN